MSSFTKTCSLNYSPYYFKLFCLHYCGLTLTQALCSCSDLTFFNFSVSIAENIVFVLSSVYFHIFSTFMKKKQKNNTFVEIHLYKLTYLHMHNIFFKHLNKILPPLSEPGDDSTCIIALCNSLHLRGNNYHHKKSNYYAGREQRWILM